MRTLLSDLPDHALLRLCSTVDPGLYPTCRAIVEKVRSVTRALEIRYLHTPNQLKVYPNLASVEVHSIDLKTHTLHSYLPQSVTHLGLKNVAVSTSLLSTIPQNVISLELNKRDPLFVSDERYSGYVLGESSDWSNGHYQDFNLMSDYDVLHSNLRRLRVGNMRLFSDMFSTAGKREMVALDFDRDRSGDALPSKLEEWYNADIYSFPAGLENLRVLHASRMDSSSLKQLSKFCPFLESLRCSSAVVVLNGAVEEVYTLTEDVELPQSLTDLRLEAFVSEGMMRKLSKSKVTSLALCGINFALLWEGLKEVYVLEYNVGAALSLGDLPRSLRRLSASNLIVSSVGRGWPQLEMLSLRSYSGECSSFPRTLLTLSVDLPTWHLVRHQELRPLSLSITNHNDTRNSEFIHSLPNSITSLEIRQANLYSVPKSVKYLSHTNTFINLPKLPRGLLVLHLDTDHTSTFASSLVEVLPRGLREFCLNGVFCLVNSALRILPQRLVRLDVNQWSGAELNGTDLPPSLAVLQSNSGTTDDILRIQSEKHPALCHAYGDDLE